MEKRIFLDYLDFATADQRKLKSRYEERAMQLKYELLANPDGRFVVAAPAIAKCDDTAFLLAQYPEMWASSALTFALDPKHGGDAGKYFRSRMSKLEAAMDESTLTSHFEYRGYSSRHWEIFFGPYIEAVAGRSRGSIEKIFDGDMAFRSSVKRMLLNSEFEEYLATNGMNDPSRMLSLIDIMANDSGVLFQRDKIISALHQDHTLQTGILTDIVYHQLDRAFSISNAESAGCRLPSASGAIDGRLLQRISPHIFVAGDTLASVICAMRPITVLELRQQSEWRIFISCLQTEISEKLSQLEFRRHLLVPYLKNCFPGRGYKVLQNIGAMIVAYLVSPFFGNGAVSRILAAIFTDLPSWFMAGLNRITNQSLTTSIIELARKLPRLSTLSHADSGHSLASHGLRFTPEGLMPNRE